MTSSELIPASRLFRFACHEDVARMPVRSTGHHCASCHKTVVDMSQLTAAEALETVRTAPPSTCVSYAFAEDGALLFRSGRRVGGTVAIALSAFLAACNPAADPQAAPTEAEVAPLELVAEEAPPAPARVAPTSPPDYHSASAAAWPSATETTLGDTPKPPPPPPVKKPLPPPPIRHTAGKPVMVNQRAGALAAPSDMDL